MSTHIYRYNCRPGPTGGSNARRCYAWWHGFYELKKRCMEIEEQAARLIESGKPATVHKVKGADGPTTKPTLDN